MAKQSEPANLVIDHFDTLDPALLEPVVAELEQSGIGVRVSTFTGGGGTMGPLAELPTVIEVAISTALFHSFLEEAGKDLYKSFKRAFALLWGRLLRERDPGYSKDFSMKLSTVVERFGVRLKLLLPPTASPEDADVAIEEFMKVALDFRQEHLTTRMRDTVAFRFIPTTGQVVEIHPDSDD